MGGGWPRPPLLTKLSISRIVGEQISRLKHLFAEIDPRVSWGDHLKLCRMWGPCHVISGGRGGRRGEAQIEGSWIPVQINEYGHWAPTIKTTILYVLSLEIPNVLLSSCCKNSVSTNEQHACEAPKNTGDIKWC